ncbi:MAG: N-acetylmuramoyl-L-alanine amidase [Candidatus Moranbacteria bacterium]|nr:N-acetylmuramoyl-L-alanine amidase [Candidatus Moranbacteria bacterium]NTW45981.1 N-acetylmuramoyl-L-alanine amidase [Candidatus Moranbacteria bacterium]
MLRRSIIVYSLSVLIVAGFAVTLLRVSFSGKRSFENPVSDPVPTEVSAERADSDSQAGDTVTADGSEQVSIEGGTGAPEAAVSSAGTEKATEPDTVSSRKEVGGVRAPKITDRLVTFGYEDRSSRNIDTIVVHSSYDAIGDDPYSVSGVIEEYRQYGVSAHYLIDRKGGISRLVEDRDVAYHAGVSTMPDGRTGANAFSIGIEVIEKDTDSPTSAQYASLRSLVTYLKGEYDIKYVLGHRDIAPGRKTDPWGFDWSRMRE